jgi:pimeloyl-ACP methyl ester carboxylesterase
MSVANTMSSIVVDNIRVDLIERGDGRPLLFLHPGIGIEPTTTVLDRLAARWHVFAPVHPGFEHSEQPKSFDTVDDLAYFYLELLEHLDLRETVVAGVSFGGWIAAEIAIKSTERLSHLVLANAVGIKVGDRETRDIVDIYSISEREFVELAYFNPDVGTHDYKTMPDAQVHAAARNREATARYAWSPYMHDPKLKSRLHRIRIPTLVLWGASDRILSETYGRAYCAAIAGARFQMIEHAGHFPHLEQPEIFSDRIFAFVEEMPR